MPLFPKNFKNYFLNEEQKSLPTAEMLPTRVVGAWAVQTSRGRSGSRATCPPGATRFLGAQPSHPQGGPRAREGARPAWRQRHPQGCPGLACGAGRQQTSPKLGTGRRRPPFFGSHEKLNTLAFGHGRQMSNPARWPEYFEKALERGIG